MFDTFDIIVPRLVDVPGLSIRQHETAFGLDESRVLHFGEVRLGTVLPAHVAFSNVTAWAGSADRLGWDVIFLRAEANIAAKGDGTWSAFLDGVQTVLEHHPQWRVICESDCDQYPMTELSLTAGGLVNLLNSYRATHQFPIAFYCEQKAESPAR